MANAVMSSAWTEQSRGWDQVVVSNTCGRTLTAPRPEVRISMSLIRVGSLHGPGVERAVQRNCLLLVRVIVDRCHLAPALWRLGRWPARASPLEIRQRIGWDDPARPAAQDNG